MKIKGLMNFDLLLKQCKLCGHLTIHGFPQQLEWKVKEDDDGRIGFMSTCENCGDENMRWFQMYEPADEFSRGAGI